MSHFVTVNSTPLRPSMKVKKSNLLYYKYYFLACGGPLKPEVVQSTSHDDFSIASNVLILGEVDAWQSPSNGLTNFWVAEKGKTDGQGFTLRLDTCERLIVGCQIKNMGNWYGRQATKDFRVLGSKNENGPWDTLVVDQLADLRDKSTSLVSFTFKEPVEIQFIKFELVSFWGDWGGGLQYFAAIPATSKT